MVSLVLWDGTKGTGPSLFLSWLGFVRATGARFFSLSFIVGFNFSARSSDGRCCFLPGPFFFFFFYFWWLNGGDCRALNFLVSDY